MTILQALKRAHPPIHSQERIAVFFTGGLDSTVLAISLCTRQPLLVFGAVQDPACAAYNKTSIRQARAIARHLRLRLMVIPISCRDYARHLIKTAPLMGTASFDEDIPAVSCMLARLKRSGISNVFSGMGSDELFQEGKRSRQQSKTAQPSSNLRLHQKISRKNGITFHSPYLSAAVTRWAAQASVTSKKNKQALLEITQQVPAVHALLKERPPAHSWVPSAFWRPWKDALWSKNA